MVSFLQLFFYTVNFSTTFTIWDILFGTFYMPKDRLPAGARLRLRLHLGAHRLECDGEIMTVHERARTEWVGHGVRFHFASSSRYAWATVSTRTVRPAIRLR